MRASESSPRRTPRKTDSYVTSGSGGTSSMSTPASTAATATSPSHVPARAPPMSSASLTMRPSKPSSPRRAPWRTSFEIVAGLSAGPPNAGTAMCAIMTAATPASTAAANGTSSTFRSRSRSDRTTGMLRCESTAVAPCPGKCFAVVRTPSSCARCMYAAPRRAACSGSSPNERVLITVFAGFVFRSKTGFNSKWIPSARASRAVTSA